MTPPELPSLSDYLDALEDPHVLLTAEHRIVHVNPAYIQRHGLPPAGARCYQIAHGHQRPCDELGEPCPMQQALRQEGAQRVVHRHLHSDGSVRTVEVTLQSLHRQGRAYIIERLRDLTGIQNTDQAALIGQSPVFLSLLERLVKVARTDLPVLILGETGSGKEMVAQALHRQSPRHNEAFVAVDCASISDSLFESEFFGHEKGAFTGASQTRIGLVESAQGGTLFLDEIGDMPLSQQVKLLRLLETGSYRRVGSSSLRRAQVRIIAATHRPLDEFVAEGRFRADLYYRLNIFPLRLPPLRERREDIPLLVQHLLETITASAPKRASPAFLEQLAELPFPGNIRELKHLLQRACLLADGDLLQVGHIDSDPLPVSNPAPLTRKAQARRLGISERTLYRRLHADAAQQRR